MSEKAVRQLGFWKSYLLTVPCFFVVDIAWSFYQSGIRGDWGASVRTALIGGLIQGLLFTGLDKVYRRSHAPDGALRSSQEDPSPETQTHPNRLCDAERRARERAEERSTGRLDNP
jgi:hypothetical protein